MPTYTLYNPTNTPAQMASLLLAGNSNISIVPSSVVLKYGTGTVFDVAGSRETASISYYDGSISQLGISPGLLLTSGDGAPPATNTEDGYSVQLSPNNTDADLNTAVKAGFPGAGDVEDATVLQFQFTVTDPNLKGIQFDLVFASDEYPEFSDSSFVDIGAVFINGVNYALFNGKTDQPLSIIDKNLVAGGFRDNASSSIPIEYDGVSVKLTIVAPVQAGVNTIKIAVGDTGDQIYDSGLFVSNMRAVPFTGTGLGTVVQGTGGNDNFVGGNFNEVFDLGLGNDFATGNGGDDLLLGGLGIDTAIYTTILANLTIAKSSSGYAVTDKTGVQGIDTLVDVERVKTSDKNIALDLGVGQAAGNTAKLIGAIFDTAYMTPEFVGIGISLFDGGRSMEQVAQLAINTGLYAQLAGSRSNADFVKLVYANVVGVAPNATDLAYFQGFLDSGNMTQAQLAVLAANTDVNALNVNLVGLSNAGIEFLPYPGG
jgi:hypothetical protein